MWLLIAFIAVPLIEIALFIQVGGFIGLWPTLLIVIVTAVLGARLVKSQGLREMANLKGSLNEMRDPTEPLANGAMILFSGALLLTPGFFTDIIGFALLLPPVRAAVYQQIRSRVKVADFSANQGMHSAHPHQRDPRQPQDRVIDGDFKDVTPTHDSPKGPSGWTQH